MILRATNRLRLLSSFPYSLFILALFCAGLSAWYQTKHPIWTDLACCNVPFSIKSVMVSPLHVSTLFIFGMSLFALLNALFIAIKSNMRVSDLLALPRAKVPKTIDRLVGSFNLVNRVIVVEAEEPFAFCFGLLKPRICISTGFIKILSVEEMSAAVLHEFHHCWKRDPLRMFAAQVMAKTFFFLPVVAEWAEGYEVQLELLADKFATKHTSKVTLAGAVLQFTKVAHSTNQLAEASIASKFSASAIRVARLLGYEVTPNQITAKGLFQSSLSIFFLCTALML